MENSGKFWTNDEVNQLKKSYINEQKDIIEIAYIHKRYPGGIIAKLKSFGIITESNEARGYENYKNSELYKEASEKARERYTKKEETNNKNAKIVKELEYIEIKNNMYELKNELKEVKLELKELKILLTKFMASVDIS